MTDEELRVRAIQELEFYKKDDTFMLADITVDLAIEALEQETDDFARWVATEIFDDNWEYNKNAFAEIACRKLEKLGIVRAKGDKWELIEPQERSDKG